MTEKIIKKGKLYYPSKEFKKKAWINDKKIYQKAAKNPIKFWEQLAQELFWFKKWKKAFSYNKPPYFQWFKGGKTNITTNIFEENSLGFDNIKNKVALIWEPEPTEEKPVILTYYELFRRVNKFSNVLKKLGVKKGDKVGIYLPMIPEAVIAMLACARIGAIHVVVFSAFSSQALKVRLEDTEAKVLITADGYYRRGKVTDLKRNADAGLKQTKVKKVVVVKRAGNKVAMKKNRDLWWDDLVKNESDICEPRVMDSEDPLFILYTSGSTGKPKGCVHVCGGYSVQAKFTGKWIFDWKKDDIMWCTADVGWVTGHTYVVYSPLLNGMTSLIFEGAPNWPNPDRWASVIEEYGVTVLYTAPTAVRMFKKYGTKMLEKYKFNTLRLLGSVGEPIDESAWKWFFREIGKERCPIVDTWWQTETGGILTTSLPGIGPFKPMFTGLPFPGIKIDILDDEGKPVPVGEKGNLVVRPPFAPSLLRIVYKNPKKYFNTYWSQYPITKKGGIYFTSDAAYKDRDGLIRIAGRTDDVIKVAGHRLSTGEMENVIAKSKHVAECAVVGIPDKIKGEVPLVFIVYKKGAKPDMVQKEVVMGLRKGIGPIASVKAILLVKDLPKTRSGKIMRRIMKRLLTGEPLGDLSTLANPESVEEVRKVLKRDFKF